MILNFDFDLPCRTLPVVVEFISNETTREGSDILWQIFEKIAKKLKLKSQDPKKHK